MIKLIKSNLWWILPIGAVVIIGGVILLISNNVGKEPEPAFSPASVPSVSPEISVSASPSPRPSGSIKVETYDDLIVQYDSRRILLASDCQSANPSNMNFKNGTRIMLDNTLSSEARVIKIGNNSYKIIAHGWTFVTLYSKELPANLPMYCGSMELGQLGII